MQGKTVELTAIAQNKEQIRQRMLKLFESIQDEDRDVVIFTQNTRNFQKEQTMEQEDTVTISRKKVDELIAWMKSQTIPAIQYLSTPEAKSSWYWLYSEFMGRAWRMGLITNSQRQALAQEMFEFYQEMQDYNLH